MAFPIAPRCRRLSALALSTVSLACTASPVDWTAPRRAPAGPASVLLDPSGALVPDSLGQLAQRIVPPGGVCAGSVRLSGSGRGGLANGGGGGTLFAIWWAPRPDSSAWLLASSTSDEGRHWAPLAVVDTTDRSVSGCRREPPAIAADSTSGYVHVTYALQAPEGPGLFFSHSMDRGRTFHSPVAILYGDRLGRTSVAADGDIVVVGFEDPNSGTPRIGLALSRTMGHIFEDRLLPISGDQGVASHPLTAVRGRQIAVSWDQRASVTAPGARVVRVGVLR
jgi:hypothetical protein